MRTIIFRAKRTGSGINAGKWVHGSLIHSLNGVFMYGYQARCQVPVDPANVGQFTGLTDRNGREIYEGDILLWTRKNVHIEGRPLQDFSHKCIVYYDNDKCAFQFRCELRCGACVGYLDFGDDRADESFVEVIGNIHDNPELLEINKQTND